MGAACKTRSAHRVQSHLLLRARLQARRSGDVLRTLIALDRDVRGLTKGRAGLARDREAESSVLRGSLERTQDEGRPPARADPDHDVLGPESRAAGGLESQVAVVLLRILDRVGANSIGGYAERRR